MLKRHAQATGGAENADRSSHPEPAGQRAVEVEDKVLPASFFTHSSKIPIGNGPTDRAARTGSSHSCLPGNPFRCHARQPG